MTPWRWRHHKLVRDNERVRVLDTRFPAGDRVNVHAATRRVCSPERDAAHSRMYTRFIESLALHSIENVGTSEIHLISVEMKF
jgi:hypothetical protein